MFPSKKHTPIVSPATFKRSQVLGSDLRSGGALEFKPDFLDEYSGSVTTGLDSLFLHLSLSTGDNHA